jgi:branched-chain amino acid transport system substrate-binding protein
MKRRTFKALSALLGMAIMACGGASGSQGTADGGVIKIGFLAERAGDYVGFGVPSYNGTNMAIQEFNKAGGIVVAGKKYTFQFDPCDDDSQEALVSQCANKLIRDDSVKFTFGGIGRFAPIVAKIADPAGVMYFTSSSSASAIIDQTQNMILTLPSIADKVNDSVLAIKAFYPSAKRVALIYADDANGQNIPPLALKAFAAAGYTVSANEKYPSGATDVTAQLTRIRATSPDVMFVGWSPRDLAVIIGQDKQLNAAPAMFGYSTGCQEAIGANVAKPYVGNAQTGAELTSPQTDAAKNFVALYKQYYPGTTPASFNAALYNYDFISLLGKAMVAAGSVTDVPAILKKVQTVEYTGVIGKVTIVNRQAKFGLDMCSVEGGKVATVKHIG